MKKLNYIMLISLLCITTLLIAQEGEPEGAPSEERAKLEEQRTKLEEEQKKLEDEQLSAQQRGDSQVAQSLEQQKQEVGQQISIVDQEIASVPEIGGGTSSASTGEQGGSIPVVTTVTEQQIIAAHDITDWQQEFNAFAQAPGSWWGKGGRLFTEIPDNQRADRLIEIIQQSPSTLFSQNPLNGVEALTSIAKLANTMKSGNYFTPNESVRDYNRVMQALSGKLQEVIKDAAFPEEPNINREFDSYHELMKLVDNLPIYYRTPLDRLILQKMSDHLTTLIDSGRVGDSPSAIINALTSGSLSQSITATFDTLSKETKQPIDTILSQKIIDVFNKTDLSKQTTQELNQLAKKVLNNVIPALKVDAQAAVVAKLADYLASTPLGADPNEAFSTFTKLYTNSTSGLNLSQSNLQKVQEGVSKAIESITSKALSLPPEKAFTTLVNMATDPTGQKLFKQLPGSARGLVDKLNSALLTTLNSHATTQAILPTADNAQSSYIDAYSTQFKQLKSYLEFSEEFGKGSENVEAQAAAAKRLTRLADFAKSQKNLSSNVKNKKALSELGENVSRFLNSTPGKKALAFLASQDPAFGPKESEQKKLFAQETLAGLPEDMLASFNSQATDLIDRISKENNGSASESRRLTISEIEEIREKLLSSEVLNSQPEAKALLEKINTFIKDAKSRDIQDSTRLKAEVEKVVSDTSKLSIENLADMKSKVEGVIRDIENLQQNALGLSSAGAESLQDSLQEATAWSGIIAIADGYHSMFAGGAGEDVGQKTYMTLAQNATETASLLDYRQKQVFTERIAMMEKQQRALSKIADLVNQQKVGDYTMVDLGNAMDAMVSSLIVPKLAMVKILESQGFITETAPGIFEPTDNGLALAEIVRENTRIADRSNQIREFTEKNKTPPSLIMERGGKPIKLAEELQLSWLILDDQLRALKKKFLEAGRDPIRDTLIAIENAIGQQANTVEEGYKNSAELLGLSEGQLDSVEELGKVAGLTPEQLSDVNEFAAYFKIDPKDIKNPHVIGSLLGLSEEDISAMPPSDFSLERPVVKRILLKIHLLKQKLQEQIAQRAAHGDVKLTNTLLLGDIADILAEQGKQAGKGSIDPYFEALVALRRKMLDMSPTEAETFKESEKFLSILGALDGNAARKMDPKTVTQNMKSVFLGMAHLMGDGLSGLATLSHKWWLDLRKGAGFITKLGAIPVAVLTYILTRMGISTAWQAGTTALTGAATSAGGPLAGILTYAALPGAGFLPDIVGILAGTAAGGLMYYVGNEITPSKEQLEKLNEELVAGGFDPVKIAEGKTWTEASKEWVTNFFKTDMAIWVATANRQKQAIEKKEVQAQRAKAEYYEMLGLPPTATDIEYQAALLTKQAEIEASWGINRWLISRRYNNAYQFMLRANVDLITANANYITVLNEMQIKALAAPAEQSESVGLAYALNWVKGVGADFYRKIIGTSAEPEKGIVLSAKQFDTFKKQVDHFYGRQVSDLMAMKDFIEKNKDEIKKASPFGDDTYFTAFQSLIDGRVAALRNEYEAGVKALLQEHGIKTVGQIGATTQQA